MIKIEVAHAINSEAPAFNIKNTKISSTMYPTQNKINFSNLYFKYFIQMARMNQLSQSVSMIYISLALINFCKKVFLNNYQMHKQFTSHLKEWLKATDHPSKPQE